MMVSELSARICVKRRFVCVLQSAGMLTLILGLLERWLDPTYRKWLDRQISSALQWWMSKISAKSENKIQLKWREGNVQSLRAHCIRNLFHQSKNLIFSHISDVYTFYRRLVKSVKKPQSKLLIIIHQPFKMSNKMRFSINLITFSTHRRAKCCATHDGLPVFLRQERWLKMQCKALRKER